MDRISKNKSKLSLVEREQRLVEQINRAKASLSRLQLKKQQSIGALACQHGLDQVDLKALDKAFADLAKGLVGGA